MLNLVLVFSFFLSNLKIFAEFSQSSTNFETMIYDFLLFGSSFDNEEYFFIEENNSSTFFL